MSTFNENDAVSWTSILGTKMVGTVEKVDEEKQLVLAKLANGNVQWFPFAKLTNETQRRDQKRAAIDEQDRQLWENIRNGVKFTRRIDRL